MSKDEINDLALSWFEKGITRIVALRGDVRNSGERYKPHPNGYQNAAEMTAGLKKLARAAAAAAPRYKRTAKPPAVVPIHSMA